MYIPEDLIDEQINDVVFSHLKNTEKCEARKLLVMKAFEEFLFSSTLTNKSLVTATSKNSFVIRFLAYRDVAGNGRTAVHDVNCYNIGESFILEGCEEFDCKTLMAAQSIRTALIVPLKEGYRRLGLDKSWDNAAGTGNPADSMEVGQYFSKVKMQQLRAEVPQKQPAVMLKCHTRQLLHGMRALSLTRKYKEDVRLQFYIKMFSALFALAAEATTRGDDLSLLLITRILRLPNKGGLIFNFVFGKVIRSGVQHPFGLPYNEEDPWSCAAALTDEFVQYAIDKGMDMSRGYLFFDVDSSCNRIPGRLSAQTMTLNLKRFAREISLDVGQNLPISMQSFRSGGAINKFLEGQPLEKVMYDAVWSNPQTTWRYMKILEVLGPFQQNSNTFNPDVYHMVNTIPLSTQASWWQAYKCASQEEMIEE